MEISRIDTTVFEIARIYKGNKALNGENIITSEKDKRNLVRGSLEELILKELEAQKKTIEILKHEVAKFRQLKQLLK